MPRRHTPPKHTPFRFIDSEASKKRYPTKHAAEKAAELSMLQKPGLELSVYQGTDGGWYLTRRQKVDA